MPSNPLEAMKDIKRLMRTKYRLARKAHLANELGALQMSRRSAW
jgi:hypothetical protein